MIERRVGADKKRSFKNLIHQKRRYVTLTENVLSWQKLAPGSANTGKCQSMENDQHLHVNRLSSPSGPTAEHKGQLYLTDISSVSVLPEIKNAFRVATPSAEVHFQAQSQAEMSEWVVLIQRQQRRHMMLLNRMPSNLLEQRVPLIDAERELHYIHTQFLQHMDLLKQLRMELEVVDISNTTLPLEEMFVPEERELGAIRLHETLTALIAMSEHAEETRQRARAAVTARTGNATVSGPTNLSAPGFDAPPQLMLMGGPRIVDHENYLHLSSGYKQRNADMRMYSATGNSMATQFEEAQQRK